MIRAYTPEDPVTRSPEFVEWLADHGLVANDIYRLETNDDATAATVYEFHRDENGRLVVNRAKDGVERLPPRHVRLTAPPPGWAP